MYNVLLLQEKLKHQLFCDWIVINDHDINIAANNVKIVSLRHKLEISPLLASVHYLDSTWPLTFKFGVYSIPEWYEFIVTIVIDLWSSKLQL